MGRKARNCAGNWLESRKITVKITVIKTIMVYDNIIHTVSCLHIKYQIHTIFTQIIIIFIHKHT